MSAPAVRAGLVGAGRLAERAYLPAFALAEGVELVAIADPVIERCRAVAPAARAYPDLESLLVAGELDAVIIASPAEHHVAHAAAVAARGLPALVEKPPAPDLEGARALAEIDGVRPRLGFNRRFDRGLRTLRARIGEGGVIATHALFHAPIAEWRAHTRSDDALLDLGPHSIDLVRWLSGTEVEQVRATALNAERAVLELVLARGVATVQIDHRAAYREALDVVLAGGRRLRWSLPAPPALRLRARLDPRAAPDALTASLARQLEAFAAAARGGDGGPLGRAADGVAAMAVIAAARASARAGGRWQPVEP
jgi:predicted dehydrogenase